MNPRAFSSFTAALCVIGVLAAAACDRSERQAGPQTQTTTGERPISQTMTIKGCLKSGLAENTFVLAEQAGPNQETATYQLTGREADLRAHVGQQVSVFGTVRSEEQVATSGADVVDKPAKGTSATPTIETTTELNVKQMTVDSITASGERCGPALPDDNQPPRRIN
jgi:hypothetical protein